MSTNLKNIPGTANNKNADGSTPTVTTVTNSNPKTTNADGMTTTLCGNAKNVMERDLGSEIPENVDPEQEVVVGQETKEDCSQQAEDTEARGDVTISNDLMNFLLLWGCSPATGVKADTTMVDDISKIFLEKVNVANLSLIIP